MSSHRANQSIVTYSLSANIDIRPLKAFDMSTVLTLLYSVPAAGGMSYLTVPIRTYIDESVGEAFNFDHYLNKHIPLAGDTWSKFGLTKWVVIELAPKTGYLVQAIMTWDSPQSLGRVLKDAGAEVMGDLGDSTTEKPVVLQGFSTRSC